MKAIDLTTITFAHGAHEPTSGEMCVMEAAAYIAGEPWSDHPQCVSPVIATFCRNWNDSLSEPPRSELLRPLLPLVIGTRTTDADEETRAWLATDWLVRVQAPAWMDLTPSLREHAAALRGLAPLTSEEIYVASISVLSAADSAAYSAACSAALSAADSAAYSAAYSAACSAADSAAYSAACSAALSAAYSAADSALAPTVTTLQASAQDLVRAMCAVGRVTADGGGV